LTKGFALRIPKIECGCYVPSPAKGAKPPLNPLNWAYPLGILKGAALPIGILKGEALKAGVGTQCPLFNWFRGGVGAKKIK